MMSGAEYVELIIVIFTAAWTAYQQWLHNRTDAILSNLEKRQHATELNQHCNMTEQQLDLKEQRRLQEARKNGG